jgi:hypothetical protein
MKKAQANQMFQMLMTLIVVGLIMLVGFKLIGSVVSRSSQIDYVKFRRTLLNSIDAVASDYNAKQLIELSVPKGTEALCFIDMAQDGSTDYALINAYWKDQDYMGQEDTSMIRNAFLVGNGFLATFHIEKLAIDDVGYHTCIPVQRSKVEFWAEGQGRTVTIKNE